jgi:hypothetical protein
MNFRDSASSVTIKLLIPVNGLADAVAEKIVLAPFHNIDTILNMI